MCILAWPHNCWDSPALVSQVLRLQTYATQPAHLYCSTNRNIGLLHSYLKLPSVFWRFFIINLSFFFDCTLTYPRCSLLFFNHSELLLASWMYRIHFYFRVCASLLLVYLLYLYGTSFCLSHQPGKIHLVIHLQFYDLRGTLFLWLLNLKNHQSLVSTLFWANSFSVLLTIYYSHCSKVLMWVLPHSKFH